MLNERLCLRRRSNITDTSTKNASAPPAHSSVLCGSQPSKMVSSPSLAADIDANNMSLQFLSNCQYVFDV
jgi:hypothetical protein